jgi:hypothetical protein
LKQTTEMAWTNKFLNIEEIATIMPVPENVAADIEINIWDDAEPYLREAFARTLDSAVFFGTNAPGSFPTNIKSACSSASNTVTAGTAAAAAGGFTGDMDNLIAAVEEDGFDVTGFVAALGAKRKFRAARNANGDRLDEGRITGDLASFDGSPIGYPMRGLWASGSTKPLLFAGDWSQFIVSVPGHHPQGARPVRDHPRHPSDHLQPAAAGHDRAAAEAPGRLAGRQHHQQRQHQRGVALPGCRDAQRVLSGGR